MKATFIEPMECLAVSKLPKAPNWVWEIAEPNAPNMPIVYLGHRQTFVLACGDTGRETKDSIRLEEVHMKAGGKVSCP
jgi:hypothetical protein